MKKLFLFTAGLFSCAAMTAGALIMGPQMQIENPEIIDTITMSRVDTNCMCVAGDNQYVIHFTNIGNEPLIVQQTPTGDPDWNCEWTREPVRPGGKGVIIICAYRQRLHMDKRYSVRDNSVSPQQFHIRRVTTISDSLWKAYDARYQQRQQQKNDPGFYPGGSNGRQVPAPAKHETAMEKPALIYDLRGANYEPAAR